MGEDELRGEVLRLQRQLMAARQTITELEGKIELLEMKNKRLNEENFWLTGGSGIERSAGR